MVQLTKDRHQLIRTIPIDGKAPQVDIFNDRRAAMTLPTPNNPGYYCIFGLKDVVTHRDKMPLEMLAEGKTKDRNKLFRALTKNMRELYCTHVYTDCSKEFQSSEIEFGRFIQRMGIKDVGLFDASEFEGFEASFGAFNAAMAPLDERGRTGMIKAPGLQRNPALDPNKKYSGECELSKELSRFQPDDIKSKPWQEFPALNAFNHLIMSYVISPYSRPTKHYTQKRHEGYGG